MVSVRFSTVSTRSPNGVIALADIIGDETYRKFFVEITNWDCTKKETNDVRLGIAV